MIDNFKEPYNNNNTLDNILQNKDYYKLLSKTSYKKHQNNIENAIKYTLYMIMNYPRKQKKFFSIQIKKLL